MNKQAEIGIKNYLTNTYIKSAEQLASDSQTVRVGAIYALEKLAYHNKDYHKHSNFNLLGLIKKEYDFTGINITNTIFGNE